MDNLQIKNPDNRYFSDLSPNEQREILWKFKRQKYESLNRYNKSIYGKINLNTISDILTKIIFIIVGTTIYYKSINTKLDGLLGMGFGIIQTVLILVGFWLLFKVLEITLNRLITRQEIREADDLFITNYNKPKNVNI